MERVCFQLQVRPDRLEEYRRAHEHVWIDMLRALADADWNNYSLFLRPDGLLIGYFETTSLAKAQAAMAATEVNARWQEQMSPYFAGLEDESPDTGFTRLIEIFHLQDQLDQDTATPDVPDPEQRSDH